MRLARKRLPNYRVTHVSNWVGLTLISVFHLSCPATQPFLPHSHQPEQNLAEPKSKSTQPSCQSDESPCNVEVIHPSSLQVNDISPSLSQVPELASAPAPSFSRSSEPGYKDISETLCCETLSSETFCSEALETVSRFGHKQKYG